MNKKQGVVLLAGVIGVILIVFFAPRYKITWIDSKNFVMTEQKSSLYNRCKGQVKYHWDKIALYAGLLILLEGFLLFALRDQSGKNNL